MTELDISFVIPVYNESGNLKQLHTELMAVIERTSLITKYEIVYVDDGSTDDSYDLLLAYTKVQSEVKVLCLPGNRGKSAALYLGIRQAKYPIIVTMDSDLQDVPSQLEKLLLFKNRGYDIVSGFKMDRKDPTTVVLVSRVLNKVLSLLYGLKIQDVNSGYKVMDKEIFDDVYLMKGLHRYIPLLALSKGYKYGEIAVVHRPRLNGDSKYSILKILPGLFDLLFVLLITKQYIKLAGLAFAYTFLIGLLYAFTVIGLTSSTIFYVIVSLLILFCCLLFNFLYLKYRRYCRERALYI